MRLRLTRPSTSSELARDTPADGAAPPTPAGGRARAALGRPAARLRAVARNLDGVDAKKVGAALAAAVLVPTGALAARAGEDTPPPRPAPVVQTIDGDAGPPAAERRSPLQIRVEQERASRDRPVEEPPAAPSQPPPLGARPEGEAARADWYRRLVERQGETWRSGPFQVNAIGLRGFDVDHGRNANGFNAWNDTIALVWNDASGKPHVRELRATTDPGMRTHPDSPDIDGEGQGDVAHLLPGQYAYVLGTHHGQYGAGNPTENVPVARDTNHDGDIQPPEERASRRRGDVGTGINLHWGPGSGAGEVGPYSLGCQVVSLDRGSFLAEVTPILEQNRGQLLYTLVDMDQVS